MWDVSFVFPVTHLAHLKAFSNRQQKAGTKAGERIPASLRAKENPHKAGSKKGGAVVCVSRGFDLVSLRSLTHIARSLSASICECSPISRSNVG